MPDPPNSRTAKRRLRRELRSRILALHPDLRRHEQSRLTQAFRELPGLAQAHNVLLYISAFPEELDTRPLIEGCLQAGQNVFCPRVDPMRQVLVIQRIEQPASDLAPGLLGIPEPRPDRPIIAPAELDWVLAPGLAFDRRAARLGRGAGHYDRLLALLPTHTQVWALAWDCQIVDQIPTEPHDQFLHGVATASQQILGPRPSDLAG